MNNNEMDKIKREIHKVLSENDVGNTGSHQAGILIPKKEEILSFFPKLGVTKKNPRVNLFFEDEFKKKWLFNFIYYNNKFFYGTRNEYRLTGLTQYIKQNNLNPGDEIHLLLTIDDRRYINYKRAKEKYSYIDGILYIKSGWKVFDE